MSILVLARRNHTEAMRVAAGLTIVGHAVRLVFMGQALAETAENAEQVELLELAEIAPETTLEAMADELPRLDEAALAEAIATANRVISL